VEIRRPTDRQRQLRLGPAFHSPLVAQGEYEDIPGFCFSAKLADIEKHGFVLTPGRYVGAEEEEAADEPFADKMNRLVAKLNEQFAEGAKLEKTIRKNFERLGYGG
jgi:type I restriction enzyme M protein